MTSLPALVFLALLSPQETSGAKQESVLALGGLDPVNLCRGDEVAGAEQRTAAFGSYLYRFASVENRDTFLGDPERWAIQWDGGCGRMGPLSGVGSPGRWAVVEERLFLFASDGCREGFLAAPDRFLTQPAAFPEASREELAKGQAWVERAVKAHGGQETLDANQALRQASRSERQGWTHAQELMLRADRALAYTSRWIPPAGKKQGEQETTSVTTLVDDRLEVVSDGVPRVLVSPEARQDIARRVHREPLGHLWARRAHDFRALRSGTKRIGERECQNLLVQHGGLITMLHLDPETARILALSWRGRPPGDGATADVLEVFEGWRTAGGVLLPIARKVQVNGEELKSLSGKWDRAKLFETTPMGAFPR